MFDKNFKIKVSGNWCEYQPNKHIDLREIISFECWADQLGNPYRFHLKNGSYHYIERYEVGKQIENVLKEQQAKVEDLEHKVKCEREISLFADKLCCELQKRIDKALKIQDEFDDQDDVRLMMYAVEQALKGECRHESDGTNRLSLPPKTKCKKCGEFYSTNVLKGEG